MKEKMLFWLIKLEKNILANEVSKKLRKFSAM